MVKKAKKWTALILSVMLSMSTPLEAFAYDRASAETEAYEGTESSEADSEATGADENDASNTEDAANGTIDADGTEDNTSNVENAEDNTLSDETAMDDALAGIDDTETFEAEEKLSSQAIADIAEDRDVSVNEAESVSDNELMTVSENLIKETTILLSRDTYTVEYKGTTFTYTIGSDSVTKKERATITGITEGGVDMEIPSFVELDGKKYPVKIIGHSAFKKLDISGRVVIPASVEQISESAFEKCEKITALSIENGVKNIGVAAFRGCTGLKGDLVIPDSVEGIEVNAFSGCTGLTGVSFGKRVRYISNFAFSECTGLNGNLIIPGNVRSIGIEAFKNCSNITAVTLKEGITSISSLAFYNCTGINESLTIPKSIQYIGSAAFMYCKCIPELTIKSSNVEIESNVFTGCDGLTTLTIEGNLNTNGNSIFSTSTCKNLTTLTIKNGVKTIGDNAFANCSNLEGELVIPGSVETIGSSAFKGCNKLSGISIGKGVKKIDAFAFSGCKDLEGDLVIPGSVKTIGEGAFSGDTGFTGKLIIQEGVTDIGSDADNAAGAFAELNFTGDLKLPKSLKTIGRRTFYKCEGLNGTLTVPSGLTSIGTEAFYGCSNLKGSIVIGSSVKTIGESAFKECRSLDGTLTISNGITSISEFAFGSCSSLKGSLTIPGSVKTIGEGAFSGDTGFDGKLTLSKNLETIGDYAFEYCENLEWDLTFPSKLKSIGKRAFANCNCSTGDLVFPEGMISVGEDVFGNCRISDATMVIPSTMTDYKGGIPFGVDCIINNSAISIDLKTGSNWYEYKTHNSVTKVSPNTTVVGILNYSLACCGIEDMVYTGSPIKQENLSVKLRECRTDSYFDINLQLNKDYTVAYKNNTNVGTATISIAAKGNYKQNEVLTFNIKPKSIGNGRARSSDITATVNDMVYTGKERISKPVIKYGKLTLKEGRDYTLTYSGNLVNPGNVTVSVSGKGNYSGSFKTTYRIYDKTQDLSKCVIAPIPAKEYTGSEIKLSSADLVVYKDGKKQEIVSSSSYRVEYENNVNAGTATVTILPANNSKYGSSKKATFKIMAKPADASCIDIFVTPMEYSGNALKPNVTVMDNDNVVDASNYTVSYANNINVPAEGATKRPTVTVTFKKNYKGKMTQEFKIEPRNLYTYFDADIYNISNPKGKVLTVKDLKSEVKYGDKKLVLNKDYILEYTYNPNDEWQNAKVMLIGNYKTSDPKVVYFKAYKEAIDINDAELTFVYSGGKNTIDDTIYTGNKICPYVLITAGPNADKLIEGTDYTISYSNNINVGNTGAAKAPTITIKGKGAYKGTLVKKFNIVPKEVKADSYSYSVTISDMKYTGKELKPKFTVTFDGRTLRAGTDYDYTYVNNIEPDYNGKSAKVVITYKGNYKGTTEAYFRIYKYDISTVTIDNIKPVVYTNGSYSLEVNVYADKKKTQKLERSKDYDYRTGNTNVGTGTVTIVGKGEYGGTKTVRYTILPWCLRIFKI